MTDTSYYDGIRPRSVCNLFIGIITALETALGVQRAGSLLF